MALGGESKIMNIAKVATNASANIFIIDSKAIARISPSWCSELLTYRVPNKIQKTAMTIATMKPVSFHNE